MVYGTPEEQIILVDFVQKALVGEHITTSPSMNECMKEFKAEFAQLNLVGYCTIGNFTMVMITMTMVYKFLLYAYQYHKQYLLKYLRDPKDMKVRIFTTRLVMLNSCLSYLSPDCIGLDETMRSKKCSIMQ